MSELIENLKKIRNNGSRKQAHIDLACRCINEVEKLEEQNKELRRLGMEAFDVGYELGKYNKLKEKGDE